MQVGVGCSIMEMTFEFSNKTRGRKHSQELKEEEMKEHGNFAEITRLEGSSEKMDLTLAGEGKLRAITSPHLFFFLTNFTTFVKACKCNMIWSQVINEKWCTMWCLAFFAHVRNKKH